MAAEDPFALEANEMSLLIHGGGVFMRLDAEGRLAVTDFIRISRGFPRRSVSSVGRIIFRCGTRRHFRMLRRGPGGRQAAGLKA